MGVGDYSQRIPPTPIIKIKATQTAWPPYVTGECTKAIISCVSAGWPLQAIFGCKSSIIDRRVGAVLALIFQAARRPRGARAVRPPPPSPRRYLDLNCRKKDEGRNRERETSLTVSPFLNEAEFTGRSVGCEPNNIKVLCSWKQTNKKIKTVSS